MTDGLGHSYSPIDEIRLVTWDGNKPHALMQAERRAQDAKQEFEHVSRLGRLSSEAVRFEQAHRGFQEKPRATVG